MKQTMSLTFTVMGILAVQAVGATYELRRIAVSNHNNTNDRYTIHCHLRSGEVEHQTEVARIKSSRVLPLKSNDAQVLRLVNAVQGIGRPELGNGVTGFTNWWVRSNPQAEFKLIRSNVHYGEQSRLFEDTSRAAKALAVYMGINCFKSFGQ